MTNDILQAVKRMVRRFQARVRKSRGTDSDYAARLKNEKAFFADYEEVHDLPPIFHYWSNKYLLPMFEPFGFTNPNDFYLEAIREKCLQAGENNVSVVSIGAGNGELEIYLAGKLLAAGVKNFRFSCLEINQDMINRARRDTEEAGISDFFDFLAEDFNSWRPSAGIYDVVIANQALHHVLELEHLFESIRKGLAEEGVFLTCDMIGRNGHMRWPEALERVEEFWEELPPQYRRNRLLSRNEKRYINHDCSTSGFEGIRAQDILPLLLKYFHFRLFLPYGNIVLVFLDRTFGHNFDITADWDLDFIDRVHAMDEQLIMDGTIKPTSMIAAMTVKPGRQKLRDPILTPEFCVRNPDA